MGGPLVAAFSLAFIFRFLFLFSLIHVLILHVVSEIYHTLLKELNLLV